MPKLNNDLMKRPDFKGDSRSVHLFQPFFRTDEVLMHVRECLNLGWTGDGFKTVEFEDAWSQYAQCKNALFLNSNTAGLFMCFETLKEKHGWNESAEVITTPLTFVSTNHAILNAGLKPIFGDVDSSLNLSPRSVLENITCNTKAVIFVGIGGNPANYHEILAICRENNLICILDAAHMAGTKCNDVQIGSDADFTILSFQAVKNCPASDAGLISALSDEDHATLKSRYWLGIDKSTFERSKSNSRYKWEYNVDYLSNKYNGNSIAASLGLVSLKYLDEDNKRRRMLSALYDDILRTRNSDLFRTIPHLEVGEDYRYETSRHLYQICLDSSINRNELILALNARDIYPGVHYVSNKIYRPYLNLPTTKTPNADLLSQSIISLPLHLRMSEDDVSIVCDALIDSLQQVDG